VKLKILEDLKKPTINGVKGIEYPDIYSKELRQEAIKHIKQNIKNIDYSFPAYVCEYVNDWIKDFFNITEKEISNAKR